jgi:hypothetical protein
MMIVIMTLAMNHLDEVPDHQYNHNDDLGGDDSTLLQGGVVVDHAEEQ